MQKLHDASSRHSLIPRRRGSAVGVAVLLAAVAPLVAGPPARAATAGNSPAHAAAPASDRLLPGANLQPGQSLTGGHDTLTMQADGNLVLTAPGRTPLWSSHTAGNSGATLVMQPNGDLAVVA